MTKPKPAAAKRRRRSLLALANDRARILERQLRASGDLRAYVDAQLDGLTKIQADAGISRLSDLADAMDADGFPRTARILEWITGFRKGLVELLSEQRRRDEGS